MLSQIEQILSTKQRYSQEEKLCRTSNPTLRETCKTSIHETCVVFRLLQDKTVQATIILKWLFNLSNYNFILFYAILCNFIDRSIYVFQQICKIWPASWSSGQSLWLLIIPGSTVGIFPEGEDSRGDHGLGRLVEFRFKGPPGTTSSYITTHIIGTM